MDSGFFLPTLGFASALLMGASLGLVGGGGSLLTVPVLVYFFGLSPVAATGESLFVVGVVSLAGALRSMRSGQLSYRTALLFALPSFTAVWLTRHFLLPHLPAVLMTVQGRDITADVAFAASLAIGVTMAAFFLLRGEIRENPRAWRVIALMVPAAATVFVLRQFAIPRLPEHWVELHGFLLTKDKALMLLFAMMMLVAAAAMLSPARDVDAEARPQGLLRLGGQGILVGLLTGLVGAGGGFLIVPALVLFAGLPMRRAVGTSLLIITINSLVGFTSQTSLQSPEWNRLLPFTGLALIGLASGAHYADRLPNRALRQGFAYGVAALGMAVLTAELWPQ